MVRDVESALRDATAARAAGADLVEFRLDEFFSGEGQQDAQAPTGDTPEAKLILHLIAESPLPCIATCRPVGAEGGAYDGPDDARIALFERLGTAFGPGERAPRYLDVELSTLQRSRNIRQKIALAIEHPEQLRDVTTSLILSSHDFTGRPPDLDRRALAMRDEPTARVHKIAYRARSVRDNLELFDLIAQSERPMIALGMGEFGLMSRILAPKFGAFLTFASLRDSEATAPGQPTLAELLGTYRFRSIRQSTKVFGIVGYPVGHSMSPAVHNAGFDAISFDGVYVPIPVVGGSREHPAGGHESLKATLLELIEHPRLHLCGLSVTIPHKESLVRLALEQGWTIDDVSRRTGAANTLVVDHDSRGTIAGVRVANTDAPAILNALRTLTPDTRGARALVLGAGGVARAAAFALAQAGASVIIANRTPARAESLARDIRHALPGCDARAGDLLSLEASSVELVINGTPIGMSGSGTEGDSPLPTEFMASLPAHAIVFDTVYNPIETSMLKAARARGLRVLSGVTMFVLQAEAQFRLFTGRTPSAGLFERVVRERLAVRQP